MNGLLLLFYCSVLAALCGADDNETFHSPSAENSTTAGNMSEASNLKSTETLTSVSLLSSSHSTAPIPVPQRTATTTTTTTTTTSTSTTVTPNIPFYRKECHSLYLVSGIVIIVCFVLLVTCLMLSCKVIHLSRRLKTLSGDADLISNSEYWMGTAKKNKSRSDLEAQETNVLMADLSEQQEAVGDGANKEEGSKVNVDGQMGEENKKKVKDSGEENKKETPVTEKSSSSKPQGETTDSPSEDPKGEV